MEPYLFLINWIIATIGVILAVIHSKKDHPAIPTQASEWSLRSISLTTTHLVIGCGILMLLRWALGDYPSQRLWSYTAASLLFITLIVISFRKANISHIVLQNLSVLLILSMTACGVERVLDKSNPGFYEAL
ncbi:MAG: hypothetical protein P9M15_05270, partial [Candidatus Electryoneaceae bacterium]|nr:hypothetical protein [Candidatus Electryoneaceae bacterium]